MTYDEYMMEYALFKDKRDPHTLSKMYGEDAYNILYNSLDSMSENERTNYILNTHVKPSEAQKNVIMAFLERTNFKGYEDLLNLNGSIPDEDVLMNRIMRNYTVGYFMGAIKAEDEFTDEEGDFIYYVSETGEYNDNTGTRQIIKALNEQVNKAQISEQNAKESEQKAQAEIKRLNAEIEKLKAENAALRAAAQNGTTTLMPNVRQAYDIMLESAASALNIDRNSPQSVEQIASYIASMIKLGM